MRVELLGDISGTRNGQQWPPRGSVVDLPDAEGAVLCSQGMARPAVDVEADVDRAVVETIEEHRALTTANGPARRTRTRSAAEA